ncbi:tRNA 4-thiouridine(8) synthase ThiI [Patescibacteria group bacterium]|nr:tRNA 4-thiouridine(8) synthase ThiI [Patescibacteria group bacterium]
MKKALLLFSGGLDSILSAKILEQQKIKVVPLCFESYFFNCKLAEKSAKALRLELKIKDFSQSHLKIIKRPCFGFGSGVNPCIDCHLLMLKKAKEIMGKEGFDILATGEVLGQRPFSQNQRALHLIEKEAGLKDQILRPLSAKLLPETTYEKKGLVKRAKLFGFQGRSRKPQIALAKSFKVKEFPSPAGGCILTELQYSQKLKILFKKAPDFDSKDCQILRRGRAFWQKDSLILVGRDEKDNKEIRRLSEKKKRDIILEPENFPGPTVLIRGFGKKVQKETIKKARELLLNYSKKLPKTIRIVLNEV